MPDPEFRVQKFRFLRFRFLFQNTADSDMDSPKSRGQDSDPMKLDSNWPRPHSVGTAASHVGSMQIHDEVFQYKILKPLIT